MSVILDTNIIIYLLLKRNLITDKATRAIFSPSNQCYVSTVSLWEIAIKKHVGKLHLDYDNQKILSFINEIGAYPMAIPPSLLNTYQSLPLLHRDPFDRMIIAHALKNNYSIVTSDKHFSQYGVKVIW